MIFSIHFETVGRVNVIFLLLFLAQWLCVGRPSTTWTDKRQPTEATGGLWARPSGHTTADKMMMIMMYLYNPKNTYDSLDYGNVV